MKLEGDGLFFSQLTKYPVSDVNNKKIGKVGDLLLNKKDWSLNSMIIYGSFIVETLESLRIIEDIDPIVPPEYLDRATFIEKRIKLTRPEHLLAKTFTGWEPKDTVHQFSKLKKLKVLDDDGLYIGHITDILFHGDGSKTLVVSGSNLRQLFDRLNIIHHKEMLIPTKFVTFITSKNINLSVNKDEIIKRDHVSLYKLVNRDFRLLQKGFVKIGSRYKYLVYETNLNKIKAELKKRSKKIEKTLQELSIKEYDPQDEKQTKEFVKIYNEIALSSVDPYEAMNEEIIRKHFNEGSYIAYRFGKPVGYVILVTKDEERGNVAAIAGIGIHHKARRKGLSTAFLKYIVEWLRENGNYVALQADILSSNVASIGLFTSLSFTKVDEFYLY